MIFNFLYSALKNHLEIADNINNMELYFVYTNTLVKPSKVLLLIFLLFNTACTMQLDLQSKSSSTVGSAPIDNTSSSTNQIKIKYESASTAIVNNEGTAVSLTFSRSGNTSVVTKIRVSISSSNNLSQVFSNLTLTSLTEGYFDLTFGIGSQSETIVLNTFHLSTFTGDKDFTVSVSSADTVPPLIETPSLSIKIKDLEPDPSSFANYYATMCNQTFSTSAKGTLYDSGGPTGNYLNNENCSFTITVPTGVVNLKFASIGIEEVAACAFDSLKIFDGADTSAPLILINGKNKACGDTIPLPINSSGRSLTLVWQSDGGVTGTGFEVSWISGPDITPNPFTFAPKLDVDFNSIISQSAPITGFDGSLLASVAGIAGSPEVRNQTTGSAWASSGVLISAGDTIEVRMTSADFYAKTINSKITIGNMYGEFFVATMSPPKPTDISSLLIANSDYIRSMTITGGFTSPMNLSVVGNILGEIRKGGSAICIAAK